MIAHDTLADSSFGAATQRRLRDFLLGAAVAGMAALFAAVSLGFGVFALYAYLQASQGRVVAASIICAAFAATAIAIWATGIARRRARRSRRAAMASSAPVEDIDALLRRFVAAGAEGDQLATAARLGRELSPMQLLALALVGGFIAGQKLSK